MTTKWTISSLQGTHTCDTLLKCLEWHAEHQGAMASVSGPEGVEYDIDALPGVAWENDPYRDPDALTPEDAAHALEN